MSEKLLTEIILNVNDLDIDSLEKGDIQGVLLALIIMQHKYQENITALSCTEDPTEMEEENPFCEKIPCPCAMVKLIAASIEILLDYESREAAYEFIQDAFLRTFKKTRLLH